MLTETEPVDPSIPGIAKAVGRVEGLLEGMGYEIGDIKQVQEKHAEDIKENKTEIQNLKDKNLVEETEKKTKEKFYKKHPIKTTIGGITIGGVSLTSITLFIIWLLEKVEVLP
jgi:hypothetical protein